MARFGHTPHRQRLLFGMREALDLLAAVGCHTVYINGSFVTAKERLNDYDACWVEEGVNLRRLDPIFDDFSNQRARQKARFFGEWFPATLWADVHGTSYLDFFQRDLWDGRNYEKGIVRLPLDE